MKKRPEVTIVIVNYNQRALLSFCIDSLKMIDYPNFETIIVDNGSKDGSVDYIEKLTRLQINGLTIKAILNRENTGFAGGNNIALPLIKGKYILLLNNDTKVTPDFLSILVEEMEKDSEIGVIQPKIVFSDFKTLQAGGSFLTDTGFLYHFGFNQKVNNPVYNHKMEIFSANGACILVRKSLIAKIGLFDPDFFNYFEESDFCWRVWLAGYKVMYNPQAVIFHKGSQTSFTLGSYFMQYYSFRNRFCSLIKNLEFEKMLKILPLHLLICNALSLVFLFLGQIPRFWAIQKAIGWNVVNVRKTLTKRTSIQGLRVKTDDELFSIIKRNPKLSYFYFFLKNLLLYKG